MIVLTTNTLVGQTGTTTARPDAHFAMLELLRTENGRQYGVDIFRTADVTTLTRATRIKISADTYLKAMGQARAPELVHKYLVWTQVQRKLNI